ncbi:MAG: DNA-processing protein DprA [Halioglobus sp.]
MYSASNAAPDGAVLLSPDDEDYPPLLREIHDPPSRLYVRGDPAHLAHPQLAIVGSRKASPAGLSLAQSLATELVAAGLSVCSGLALGIDGAAHRGALAGGGPSVAVMGTGIDRVYPRRHAALAAELEASGCLVTELPPGAAPVAHHFPRRNRIISGLSLGVLVVEAALPSGSLLTAQSALEQGREVFALPWSVPHAGGRGCLKLLRDGATMALTVDDILTQLTSLYQLQLELLGDHGATAGAPQDLPQSGLLALIGYEETSLDDLLRLSERPTGEVLGALSALEIAGKVLRTAGGYIRT